MAMGDQLAHRGRREADAVLVRLDLPRDSDDHKRFTLPSASGIEVCSPSSIFAIWLRCTSSGPSAKRSVRACAYASARPKSSAAAAVHLHRPVDHPQATFGANTLIIAISFFAALLPTVSIFHAAFSTMARRVDQDARLGDALARHALVGDASSESDALARLHIFSSARSAWPMSRMQ